MYYCICIFFLGFKLNLFTIEETEDIFLLSNFAISEIVFPSFTKLITIY